MLHYGLTNRATKMSKLLTPAEVAEQLQVGVRTVYAYIREDLLPATKLGHRTIRIHQHDVDNLINTRTERSECN